MWFQKLVGFKETSLDEVRSKLEIDGNRLRSKVNGKEFVFGELEIVSLQELRDRIDLSAYGDNIEIEEVAGDVQAIHQDPVNDGAIFQVASQFNLLEMVGPEFTPEDGVDIYEHDFTQGPACAIACGAGTIYRNYFVEVNGQIGQSNENQIDCLDDVCQELGNSNHELWEMKNGYVLPTFEGLKRTTELIQSKSPKEYDQLKSKLKVGVQWSTQVTLNNSRNLVTQVYCSALPVAYSGISTSHWEAFACIVLEATYESMLCAALINYEKTGNQNVFLTLVGGGAFGNKMEWIFDALRNAIQKFRHTPLKLKIVSYGSSKPAVRTFVESLG